MSVVPETACRAALASWRDSCRLGAWRTVLVRGAAAAGEPE